MASFSWKDPKTGKTYTGAEGQRRWVASMAPAAPAKGVQRPGLLGPPPVGTYDPAIDYTAGASQRGYDQTAGDAQTKYEQGQQDFQRGLAGLLTRDTRLGEDYTAANQTLDRNYSILGHQQGDKAAQQGITSAGLLAKSQGIRDQNKALDWSPIRTAYDRGLADTQEARTSLNVDNARQFGGFGGNQIVNPLTGKPEFGSLLTQLTRAGTENNAFQSASAGQRAYGAAANGYVPPVLSTTQAGYKAFRQRRLAQARASH